MKDVKKFVLVDFIIFAIKVIGGLLCQSLTMLASSIYELSLLLIGLFLYKKKDNKKYKGIISSLFGLVIVLLSLGMIYYGVVVRELTKTSWFVILFVLLCAIVRYIVTCFSTNMSYQKKEGMLSFGKMHSTVDFIHYGFILGALVAIKLSKWVKLFKYADILCMIILVLFVVYKGIKIIVNSFKYLEDKELMNEEEVKTEIGKRDEIKSVEKLEVSSFGGLNYAHCNIVLKDNISMVDVNTFVLTLQDYLLKYNDMARINLVKKQVIRKAKVRSKKQDARNSGSRNSKTNTKKKNTKQKNKKR